MLGALREGANSLPTRPGEGESFGVHNPELHFQAESLADAKPGHGYKEQQRPKRLSQFHHDAEDFLRTDDDGFVAGL